MRETFARPAVSAQRMSGVRRSLALARKDLLLEWRGRETATTLLMVTLLVVLLLGFALGSEPERAPAVLWVSVSLAAMIGIIRPTSSELEQGAWETLVLYPGSREHLFWGKWAALTIVLAALLGALLPLVGIFFNLDLWTKLPALFGVGMLGIIGLTALGTLFSALLLHVRGRELLMPLLLLPASLPIILGGMRLMEAVLSGRPGGLWLRLVGVFDILFLLVAPILFEVVVEEA